MGQILVRNLDDAVIARMKARARRENTSLEQKIRDLIIADARPTRAEIIEEAREIRERVGPVEGNSVALIREDRDNDEPYR